MMSLLLYGVVYSLQTNFGSDHFQLLNIILQFWIGKGAVKYPRPVGHKSSELKYVQYVSK